MEHYRKFVRLGCQVLSRKTTFKNGNLPKVVDSSWAYDLYESQGTTKHFKTMIGYLTSPPRIKLHSTISTNQAHETISLEKMMHDWWTLTCRTSRDGRERLVTSWYSPFGYTWREEKLVGADKRPVLFEAAGQPGIEYWRNRKMADLNKMSCQSGCTTVPVAARMPIVYNTCARLD